MFKKAKKNTLRLLVWATLPVFLIKTRVSLQILGKLI